MIRSQCAEESRNLCKWELMDGRNGGERTLEQKIFLLFL